MRLAIIFVDGD